MSDFNDNISQIRRNLGLSREAFAEPLGVTPDKIRHIENGKQRADHEVLAAIHTIYGTDINALLTGEIGDQPETKSDPSFVQIPRYTVSASAGNGNSFIGDEMDVTYYAFNLQWIKRRGLTPKELQIIEVKGDSMEPKLREGDLILIDRSQVDPKDGKAFVVRVWDDLVVKHVQIIGESAISLVSANSVYPPRELKLPLDERDFQIMGQVVASMHEW